MLVFAAIASSLVGAAVSFELPPGDAQACVNGDECTAFMQLNMKVQATSKTSLSAADSDVSNKPVAIGRTIISADPQGTAEWMVKYYPNAKVLPPLNACENAERVAVELQLAGEDRQLLIFIKDESLQEGQFDPLGMTSRVEGELNLMFQGKSNYTWLLDNHDGFHWNGFQVEEAIADGGKIGSFTHYADNGDVYGPYVMYFFPHTMYGIQIEHGSSTETVQQFSMDDCRQAEERTAENTHNPNKNSSSLTQTQSRATKSSSWSKVTLASADPGSAATWAGLVFEAEPGVAPYPWPPVPNCTAATWVTLTNFELHFVYAPEYESSNTSIGGYTDRVLAARDVAAGKFDAYMHNSVIFSVADLDPYIQRLRANSFPFLLVEVGNGEFALFATVDKNDITVQLRSTSVSLASPSKTSVCAQQFSLL